MTRPFIPGYIEVIRVAHAFDAPYETIGAFALENGACRVIDDGTGTREEVPKENIRVMLEIIASFRRDGEQDIQGAKGINHKAMLVESYNAAYAHLCTRPESLGGLWVNEIEVYQAMIMAGYSVQNRVFADGVTVFNFIDNDISKQTNTADYKQNEINQNRINAIMIARGALVNATPTGVQWKNDNRTTPTKWEILQVGVLSLEGKGYNSIMDELFGATQRPGEKWARIRREVFLTFMLNEHGIDCTAFMPTSKHKGTLRAGSPGKVILN